MAASCGKGLSLLGYLFRRHLFSDVHLGIATTTVRYRSSSASAHENEESIATFDEVVEEELAQEEALQDISGLTEAQRRRLHGELPEIRSEYQQTVRYQRKLYAKFGVESGVDPRLMWPTKQQAAERLELEKEWEPSLGEKMAALRTKKLETARQMQEREEKVARNMAKMDQWIAEYRKKLAKKDEEAKAKEDKKRKLLEEAREYFGYYVDPRDAKFQEMLEERELREKELAKKKKKEKRLERAAASLKFMAQEAEKKS